MYGVIAGDRLNYRKFYNKELRVVPENDLRKVLAVSEATGSNANLDDIGKLTEPVILFNGFMGGAAWWKMKQRAAITIVRRYKKSVIFIIMIYNHGSNDMRENVFSG
jgi:hypothetical protein